MTQMPVTWHREFTGDMAGLVEACGWIEELSSSNGLSDDTANAIQVCFDFFHVYSPSFVMCIAHHFQSESGHTGQLARRGQQAHLADLEVT